MLTLPAVIVIKKSHPVGELEISTISITGLANIIAPWYVLRVLLLR